MEGILIVLNLLILRGIEDEEVERGVKWVESELIRLREVYQTMQRDGLDAERKVSELQSEVDRLEKIRLQQIAQIASLMKGSDSGPTVDQINDALLTGTLGLGQSGVAVEQREPREIIIRASRFWAEGDTDVLPWRKIQIIKIVRAQMGVGLIEAKRFTEGCTVRGEWDVEVLNSWLRAAQDQMGDGLWVDPSGVRPYFSVYETQLEVTEECPF